MLAGTIAVMSSSAECGCLVRFLSTRLIFRLQIKRIALNIRKHVLAKILLYASRFRTKLLTVNITLSRKSIIFTFSLRVRRFCALSLQKLQYNMLWKNRV